MYFILTNLIEYTLYFYREAVRYCYVLDFGLKTTVAENGAIKCVFMNYVIWP